MAAQQDITSDCEIQAVIKCLNMEKVSGAEIRWRLCAVYGADKIMSKQYIYEKTTYFDEG